MSLQAKGSNGGLNIQDELTLLAARVDSRLNGRIRNFHLFLRETGLVLSGFARTYYAKQLAQQTVMEASTLPIQANEIEVL